MEIHVPNQLLKDLHYRELYAIMNHVALSFTIEKDDSPSVTIVNLCLEIIKRNYVHSLDTH